MKMSKSESGKLGSIQLHENTKTRYYLDPKVCLHCEATIPYEKRFQNKFCNHSCSATYNNVRKVSKYGDKITNIKPRNGPIPKNFNKTCIHCSSIIDYSVGRQNKLFCSLTCSAQHRRDQRRNAITLGTEHCTPKVRRGYLIEARGYSCEECDLQEWNGMPIPLELHHIDGNSEHNHFDNLQMLCCNCHAQTGNHKGKNKGKGRSFRRQRYAEGKSW